MSRDLHYFFEHASRELDSGPDHSAFPSMEELTHQLRQIDKMQSNVQEVLRLRSAPYPYGSIFVKHEEDPRMMDVMPSNGYAGRPVSPGSVSGSYQDGPEFWNSDHPEHGRSKYKKRSVCSCSGEELMWYREPLHRGNAIVVTYNQHRNGDVALMVPERCVMPVVYVTTLIKKQS